MHVCSLNTLQEATLTALIMPLPTIEPPLSSSTAFLQLLLPAVAAAAAADADEVIGEERSSGWAVRCATTLSANLSACSERSLESVVGIRDEGAESMLLDFICKLSARKKAVAGSASAQSCCSCSSARCCSSRVMDWSRRNRECPIALPVDTENAGTVPTSRGGGALL